MQTRRDRWRELLKCVASDDGLLTREEGVGSWTLDKLFWWNGYIEITTKAMVGNPNWPGGLVYVDLFAGPGVCTLKETGERFPGSPILAAKAPKPFSRILLCEKNRRCADACAERLKWLGVQQASHVFCGDCNDHIEDLCRKIPGSSLTLAFLDPTGLHAK